jgi:SCF-associated factor 1
MILRFLLTAVLGTLDGSSYALAADGYSEPGKTAATPLKLSLHAPTRAIRYSSVSSAGD